MNATEALKNLEECIALCKKLKTGQAALRRRVTALEASGSDDADDDDNDGDDGTGGGGGLFD